MNPEIRTAQTRDGAHRFRFLVWVGSEIATRLVERFVQHEAPAERLVTLTRAERSLTLSQEGEPHSVAPGDVVGLDEDGNLVTIEGRSFAAGHIICKTEEEERNPA